MQVIENLDARQIWFDLAHDSVTRAMPIQGKGVLLHVEGCDPILISSTCLVQYVLVKQSAIIGGEAKTEIKMREIVDVNSLKKKAQGVKAGALITFQVSEQQPPLVGASGQELAEGDGEDNQDGGDEPPPPDDDPGQQGAEA